MIVQFGIPRSGTTVIWQILNELFPNDVLKTHTIKKYNCKAVLTVRDFRDTFVSQLTTNGEKKGKMECVNAELCCIETKSIEIPNITKNIIDKYSIKIKNSEKLLQKYLEIYNNNNICLKYEYFFENFEYIFDKFETFFNIMIDNNIRNYIKYKYNIESNKKISNMLEDFNQWDSKSLIHGHHIINGKPGNWRYVVPRYLHHHLNKSLANILKKWGYEL